MERMRILNSRRLTFCEKRNQCCGKGFCLAMGINDSEDSIGQRSTLPSHLYTGHIITSIRVYKKLPAVLSMTQNGIWKQRGKLIDKQWWSIRFGVVAAVKNIFLLKLNILNKIYDENWQLCFINIPGVSERKMFHNHSPTFSICDSPFHPIHWFFLVSAWSQREIHCVIA